MTAHWEEKAFFYHVVFVTNALLLETHKLNATFGKFKNPYKKFEIFLYVAGYLHIINPALMFKYPEVVYIHVPVCFTIHVFHMIDVQLVFSHANLHDPFHFIMLLILNLLELATNVAFVFAADYQDVYTSLALTTEVTCLMILAIKLQKKKHTQHHQNRVVNASSSVHSESSVDDSKQSSYQVSKKAALTSRSQPKQLPNTTG